MSQFRPAQNHLSLGDAFFDRVAPADFPQTILRHRDQRWAQRMGLGDLTQAQWLAHFGRFEPLPGSLPQPLALRYHGHQFRSYNADLGDGRGFLFAQGHDLVDGRLLDFGTKGSGKTPWSRGGDGRLTLKGGVREVLATEMLEALGVYTSKSFSLVETGEALYRGDEPSPTRSAVLVRLNHSHIRIGTFQRLAYLEDAESLARLLYYAIAQYYPELADAADKPAAFLEAVVGKVAKLGAQWIAAGFVHGVLNTDNINITGESFDYGPWRFLPAYDPDFTAAYFDETGLYSFGRQPDTLAWNLTRLAESLLPLSSIEALEPALNTVWPIFRAELPRQILRRLGLKPRDTETDGAFVTDLFGFLSASKAPYEQFFFDWRGGALSAERAARSPSASLYATEAFRPVAAGLEHYGPADDVNLGHAYFARATPRTMLIEDMEAIWAPIAQDDDWRLFESTLADIAEMRDAYGIKP
ncbi:MAG: YdiU family protein [Alphaproteobacteria bacterium]|nr:YdiU family protein [Alphaproteobacteria bacterium]MBU1562574.1 YdiU family protein [Alphaproteobacteria bacterium]MBU2303961.1 YdiU family protein [Alphaproteobacteria bacterium]MBU2369024.1 YdiU family protein [Alphaproteobacteria bacterium]